MGHLPFDLLVSDIIPRTSLDVVARFRLLSRAANAVTYEPTFQQNLIERTRIFSGSIKQRLRGGCFFYAHFHLRSEDSESDDKLSLRFLPVPLWDLKNIQVLATAKQGGLVLVVNREPGNTKRRYSPEFYVCKPTTGQWRMIPNPRTRFPQYAVAIVALGFNPLRYKIVRLCEIVGPGRPNKYDPPAYAMRWEVFDSDKWAWKRLDEDVKIPSRGAYLVSEDAVYVSGELFWLFGSGLVVAFDVRGESWRFLNLPPSMWGEEYFRSRSKLVEYEGRLGMQTSSMGDNGDEVVVVRVMTHPSGRAWTKPFNMKKKVGSGLGSYYNSFEFESDFECLPSEYSLWRR